MSGFDVQSQQRFGIGHAQIHPPVRKLEAHAIGSVQCGVLLGEVRLHGSEHGLRVVDGVVDLAAARVGGHARADQFGEFPALAAHQFGDQQPGDHAAVAVGEVAEVVMGAHLTAVDGVFLAHALLDEGMAGLALDRLAAVLLADVDGVPGQPRVVDDPGARVLLQEGFGEQTDDVVALDEFTVLVEQEAAVEVAVPGDAHVGVVRPDRIGGGRAIFRQDGVGDAVGEAAVRLMVDLDELHRHAKGLEALLQSVDDVTGGAVAGVDHQLERLERRGVDVAEQVFDVGILAGLAAQAAALLHRREGVFLGQALDILEAGVAADRLGAAAHQLHAVEVDGVVAGGDFDATVDIEVEGGEVDFFGAGHAEVDDVAAGVHQAVGQGLLEALGGQAHVAADDDAPGIEELRIGAADAVGDVFVELGAELATDVIGFEAGQAGHD